MEASTSLVDPEGDIREILDTPIPNLGLTGNYPRGTIYFWIFLSDELIECLFRVSIIVDLKLPDSWNKTLSD